MTKLGSAAATLVLVAILFVAQPDCVYACSCRAPGPPAQALAGATAVFAGQVSAFSLPVDQGGAEPVEVTFTVIQSWKGAPSSTIVVNTPASSASCGVDFVPGRAYLVYARDSNGRLETNLCSRTTQLELAGDGLTMLGAGSVVAGSEPPATLPVTGGSMHTNRWRTTFGALLLIVVGAGVLTLKGRIQGDQRRWRFRQHRVR